MTKKSKTIGSTNHRRWKDSRKERRKSNKMNNEYNEFQKEHGLAMEPKIINLKFKSGIFHLKHVQKEHHGCKTTQRE